MAEETDYTVTITNTSKPILNSTYSYYQQPVTNSTYIPTYWYYPSPVYLYQIRCPRKTCRTFNWIELDKVKECVTCGSRIKAVADEADYEVKVNK